MLNFRIVLDPSVISSLSWERFSVMSAAAVDMYLLGKLVMDLLKSPLSILLYVTQLVLTFVSKGPVMVNTQMEFCCILHLCCAGY